MQLHNRQNFYLKKTGLFLTGLFALTISCKKERVVQSTILNKTEVQNLIPETLLYTIKGEDGVEFSIKGVGSKVFIYNSRPWQALGSINTKYKIVSKYDDRKCYVFDSTTPFGKRTLIPVVGAIKIIKGDDDLLYEEAYNFGEYAWFCDEFDAKIGPTRPPVNLGSLETSGVGISDFYWPKPKNGKRTEIRVQFIDVDPDIGSSDIIAELQGRVEKSARVWEQHAYIHLNFVDPSEDADIRIKMHNGPDGPNNSQFGMLAKQIPKKDPTMNFTSIHRITEKKIFSSLVQHEFGHALGLLHEHNHSEANINFRVMTILFIELYRKLPEQAEKSAMEYLPAKLGLTAYEIGYPNPFIEEKPYDLLSIMHYEIPASANSNGRAINRGKNNLEISAGDKAFIRTIYPFPN